MTSQLKIRISSLLLAVCLILSAISAAPAYAAEGDLFTADVGLVYGQTDARTMIDAINELRADDLGGAWYWNSDNNTTTVFNVSGTDTLSPLTYDYTLEKVAMQRAAEIALTFEHQRPDGTLCFTAYPDEVFYYSKGENIAVGYRTAQAAFTAWCEDEEDYSGQGHRRNMLSPKFNIIGIGHALYNGYHYWVQEFGRVDEEEMDLVPTPAVDAVRTVPVQLPIDNIVALSCDPDAIELEAGETAELPEFSVMCSFSEGFPYTESTVTIDAEWVSDDPAVADIVDGRVEAKGAGTATITAGISDWRQVSCAVTVTGGEPVVETGSITGVIRSSGGDDPITVVLSNSERSYSATLTGGEASYKFENVVYGDYVLHIYKKNHVDRMYDVSVGGAFFFDPEIRLIGDVDGNGRVNIGDYNRIYDHVLGTSPIEDDYAVECADVDGNGRVNIGDYNRVYDHVLGTGSIWE